MTESHLGTDESVDLPAGRDDVVTLGGDVNQPDSAVNVVVDRRRAADIFGDFRVGDTCRRVDVQHQVRHRQPPAAGGMPTVTV